MATVQKQLQRSERPQRSESRMLTLLNPMQRAHSAPLALHLVPYHIFLAITTVCSAAVPRGCGAMRHCSNVPSCNSAALQRVALRARRFAPRCG